MTGTPSTRSPFSSRQRNRATQFSVLTDAQPTEAIMPKIESIVHSASCSRRLSISSSSDSSNDDDPKHRPFPLRDSFGRLREQLHRSCAWWPSPAGRPAALRRQTRWRRTVGGIASRWLWPSWRRWIHNLQLQRSEKSWESGRRNRWLSLGFRRRLASVSRCKSLPIVVVVERYVSEGSMQSLTQNGFPMIFRILRRISPS